MATYTEIHLRRDSALNWEAANPRLALGEPGVEMNASGGYRIKVGNGIDRWKQLPYINDDLYSQLNEIQQKGYDKAQELLDKIEANKLNADSKYLSATNEIRSVNRELGARMSALEAEQEIYEDTLTGEFEETKAEVQAGLDDFVETRHHLTARMDAIAGQTTEDTEILDARVDVDNRIHPNLGGNVRSVQHELRTVSRGVSEDISELSAETASLRRTDARHEEKLLELETEAGNLRANLAGTDEYLQEQIDDNAAGIIQIAGTLSDEIQHSGRQDEELSGLSVELAAETTSRTVSDEALQEQIDRNAESNIRVLLTAQDMNSRRKAEIEREANARRVSEEHLQEQIDTNAEAVIQSAGALSETIQHSAQQDKEISELRSDAERETTARAADDEDLQTQVNANAEANIRALLVMQEAHSRSRDKLEREASVRTANDEHLQEQIDTNAEAVIQIAGALSEEVQHSAEQDEEITELQGGLVAEATARAGHDEDLQAQADTNAEATIRVLLAAQEAHSRNIDSIEREAHVRAVSDTHLQEQADDNAEAVIHTLSTVQEVSAQSKSDLEREAYARTVSEEHLQEQADDNAEGIVQAVSAVQELNAQSKADLERESYARTVSEEHLQEQADDNAEGILNLSVAMENALKDQKSPVNWSSVESLAIPEPRCAVVNFSGLDAMPTTKTADTPAVIEFWDMQGNYFKKNVVLNAQGFTSLRFIKKNVKVDLLNEDGSEFDLKIGNWVTQDGFHLKAYYRDLFRGIAVTSYKFWDDMMRSEGLSSDRPYKKAMLTDNVEDLTLQIDTGALCHPDGFPCVVYVNGEFYGVFSWQLKKQRKNYHLEKSNVKHIHLDGGMYPYTIWEGVIDWTAFEVRNPNKLYTMDGKKYDGDSPKELIDETSEKYNPSNKDHVRSATVKRYIQNLADSFKHVGELYALYGKNNPECVRVAYEEIIDWESQRDYLIFSDIVRNADGANGWNAQWFTYDGVKWYINAYDLDVSLGLGWTGTVIDPPLTGHIYTKRDIPMGYIPALYNSELEARYKELREAGIISVDNILNKLAEWTARVGIDNYELEYERWPESPCIVNFTDSIYRVKEWLETDIVNMDRVYHYTPSQEDLAAEITELRLDSKSADESLAHIRQMNDALLQEQANDNAEAVLHTLSAMGKLNTQSHIDLERESYARAVSDEDLQAQADTNAEATIQVLLAAQDMNSRRKDEISRVGEELSQETQARLTASQADRQIRYEHDKELQGQVDRLAEAFMWRLISEHENRQDYSEILQYVKSMPERPATDGEFDEMLDDLYKA